MFKGKRIPLMILTLKKASGPSLAVYKKSSIRFYIENKCKI